MKSRIVNNYKIFAFSSKEELLNYIKEKKKILIAMNAEKIMNEDDKFKKIVNLNIGYPDGIGAVLALKKKGLSSVRLPGVELWIEIIRRYVKEKSFYLIGAKQEVIEKTVERLKNDFPGINILNYHNGFLRLEDIESIKKDLILKKPDIIFVAQGSPKQEFLMYELMKVYQSFYMGLGGSFDVYCGIKKRAPIFFRRLNIEWLYRLVTEPRKRLKRQLALLKFLFIFFKL